MRQACACRPFGQLSWRSSACTSRSGAGGGAAASTATASSASSAASPSTVVPVRLGSFDFPHDEANTTARSKARSRSLITLGFGTRGRRYAEPPLGATARCTSALRSARIARAPKPREPLTATGHDGNRGVIARGDAQGGRTFRRRKAAPSTDLQRGFLDAPLERQGRELSVLLEAFLDREPRRCSTPRGVVCGCFELTKAARVFRPVERAPREIGSHALLHASLEKGTSHDGVPVLGSGIAARCPQHLG